MNDYDLLEKMIEVCSDYVKGEITSKDCSAKMVSLLNDYKEQLNILCLDNFVCRKCSVLTYVNLPTPEYCNNECGRN